MTYLVESCEERDGRYRVVVRGKGFRWPRLALLVEAPIPDGSEVSLENDGSGTLRYEVVEISFPPLQPEQLIYRGPKPPEAPRTAPPGPGGP